VTPQSAKAKGRRLQQAVRDLILKHYPSLEPDDVRSVSMGAGGEDIQLSPAGRRAFPYSIECKARAGLTTLYGWYEQAKGHGSAEPLLVLKQDRQQPLAVIRLDHLMELLKR
jgi:hypothetical protein